MEVLYRHFINSIENYFSILKSRLQKLDGLTHENKGKYRKFDKQNAKGKVYKYFQR